MISYLIMISHPVYLPVYGRTSGANLFHVGMRRWCLVHLGSRKNRTRRRDCKTPDKIGGYVQLSIKKMDLSHAEYLLRCLFSNTTLVRKYSG